MPTREQLAERPPVVEAEVIYALPMDHRPTTYLGGEEADKDDTANESRIVAIHNVRHDPVSYDAEGFALFPHKTAVTNFRDPDQIKTTYRQELEQLVKEVTGASKVAVWQGGAARLAPRHEEFRAQGTTYPSPTIHGDYTENSAPGVVTGLIGKEEAKTWLQGRYAIFSLWRAFSNPPQDVPLCLLDYRTIDVAKERQLGDVYYGKGPIDKRMHLEGSGYFYSPRHRWCYFRDMTRDEVLFIKTYDSDHTRAWQTPHTSFVDPSAPPDAPPRESLDIRAVAFWE
jgi:hypothetical protein